MLFIQNSGRNSKVSLIHCVDFCHSIILFVRYYFIYYFSSEENITEKEVDDLSNLDNLEILNGCTDRDLYNPKMMDLSDFADNFDINIPPIDNVDSGMFKYFKINLYRYLKSYVHISL